MSLMTSADRTSASEESTVPELRVFQLGGVSAQKARDSVNLFSGKVAMPIELARLTAPGSLEATVTLRYNSDVADAVRTWNVESPTGVAGLGWNLAYERIELDAQGATDARARRYFLVTADGATNRLFKIGETTEYECYEPENYNFWQIRFHPATDRWVVITDDGITRQYGGTANSTFRAVHWGGPSGIWTGSSVVATGQESFTMAWCLTSVTSAFGDAINYGYSSFPDDSIAIGATTAYTRAAYLTTISVPGGHTLTLNYAPKIANHVIAEYRPQYTTPSGAMPAWQERYATRYLASVALSAGDTLIRTVRLSYSVDNFSDEPANPLLYKRYLRSIAAVNAAGAVEPPMTFSYVDGSGGASSNRGALSAVRYPEGGTVTYLYNLIAMPGTDRELTVDRSIVGDGVPRVFFGADYAVLVCYDAPGGDLLHVNVFDWNGHWRVSQPLALTLPGSLDLTTLSVDSQDDWFALSFTTTASGMGNTLGLYAIRRVFGTFGMWESAALDVSAISPTNEAFAVATGSQFVVATADQTAQLVGYAWSARERSWRSVDIAPAQGGDYALAAFGHELAVCQYIAQGAAALSLYLFDATREAWAAAPVALDTVAAIWGGPNKVPKLNWAMGPAQIGATFITAVDSTGSTVDYSVRGYTWNQTGQSAIGAAWDFPGYPLEPATPFFHSRLAESLLGNLGNLARFNGEEWVTSQLTSVRSAGGSARDGVADPPDTTAAYAYGNDLAVLSTSSQTVITTYDAWTNSYVDLASTIGYTNRQLPSVSGGYVTGGAQIYALTADRALVEVGHIPPNAQQLFNAGPDYILYNETEGASFVQLLDNGGLYGSAIPLAGQAFASGSADGQPGTQLASGVGFLTFTGASLDEAQSLTFHRVLDNTFTGAIEDFVVSGVSAANGTGDAFDNTFVYLGNATSGPFGLSSQYSQVKTIPGSTSPDETPFGWEVRTFFNALADSPENDNDASFYLNGLLSRKQAYDANGFLLAETSAGYDVVRSISLVGSAATQPLMGAYARQRFVSESIYDPAQPAIGPLQRTQSLTYNDANGRRAASSTTSRNSRHVLETRTSTFRYGFEIYPDMAAVNLLSAIAERRQQVDGADISVEAQTWSGSWVTPTGSVAAWAPRRTFGGLAADVQLSQSDWDNVTMPSAASWVLLNDVQIRDASGNMLQSRDASGLVRSWQFDTSRQLCTARWSNASLADGQLAYLGFEPYESVGGWTLGGSATALQAGIVSGVASTGSCSLAMPGGTTAPALMLALPYVGPGGRFLFSYWVKTAHDFVASESATASINWTGGGRSVQLMPTNGTWVQQFVDVTLPVAAAPLSVAIALINRSAGAVWVDDVRVSPWRCEFSARIYEPHWRRNTATLNQNGQRLRQLYDAGATPLLQVGPDDATMNVVHMGSSIVGHAGVFDTMRPNLAATIRPQRWGFYQSFDTGADWQTDWTSPTMTQWNPVDGTLVHTAGSAGTLQYEGIPSSLLASGYGMSVRARMAAPRITNAGFVLGSTIQCVWDVNRYAWHLTDSATAASVWAAPRTRLTLPASAYAPSLDAAEVSPDLLQAFAVAGLPLAPDGEVAVVRAASQWTIVEPAGGAIYYLSTDSAQPSVIVVQCAPAHWTLLVEGTTCTLLDEGGVALSYEAASPPTGAPGLMATDGLVFDHVALFADMQVEMIYLDGLGMRVQQQVRDGAAVTANATFYDGLQRPVIRTQGATVTPASGTRYAFLPTFADFDWSTLALTGTVATANPRSGSYAYWRKRHESSPLGRLVELGKPGLAFAITPDPANNHTEHRAYGLSSGALGYEAGDYLTTTTTDADGHVVLAISDMRNLLCAQGALQAPPSSYLTTVRQFDGAGNLNTVQTPLGWGNVMLYDFLGRQVSATTANGGTTRSMYDRAGRLRFRQSAQGAAATSPYVSYWKYDELSRVVEEGCLLMAWTDPQLAQQVNEQAWPGNGEVVTLNTWDDGDDLTAILRLTSAVSQNEIAAGGVDAFVATEGFTYDVVGAMTSRSLTVPGVASATYTATFTYNLQGDMTFAQYPGAPAAQVVFDRDSVGRLAAIGVNGVPTVAYAYDGNGNVTREAFTIGTTQQTTFGYEAPGWLNAVESPLFSQTIDYTTGGVNGAGFYTGRPAAITDSIGATQRFAFAYDSVGRLHAAQYGTGSGATSQAYAYDDNSNLLTPDGSTLTFTASGHDQAQTITQDGSDSVFSYDANGAQSRRLSAPAQPSDYTITWDWFREMPLQVAIGPAGLGQIVMNVRYGADRKRVFKRVTSNGVTTTKLYLRDPDGRPLVELTDTGNAALAWVYSPLGAAVVLVSGAPYSVARDRVGSLRAIWSGNNAPLAQRSFLPFGAANGPAAGSNPAAVPYGFAARELDESGFYDFMARWYDPRQGRFLSVDPSEQFASPYIFVGNLPVAATDPDGEEAVLIALLIGLIIGAVAGAIQATVVIATDPEIRGGKAAGVFFGFVGLGAAAGAVTGGVGGLAAQATSTAATVGAVAGTIATAGAVSAAESAGQAALTNQDEGQAAWVGAITGALAEAAGGAANAGFGALAKRSRRFIPDEVSDLPNVRRAFAEADAPPLPLDRVQRAQYRPPSRFEAFAVGALAGMVGGAASGTVASLVQGDSGSDLFLNVLQSTVYGASGGIATLGERMSQRIVPSSGNDIQLQDI